MSGTSNQRLNPLQRILPNRPRRNSESEVQELPWFKLFLVPIACYAPAFLLVFLSFQLFKPANTSNSGLQTTNTAGETKKESNVPKGAADLKLETSPLAREYIRAEVSSQVKTQSEQAAKDEIEKLKADWKGDLFGQIAFSVLFAIASIFAAFAVKDILTEILKEQEKQRIKVELKQELEAFVQQDSSVARRLQVLQAHTIWLEHESLNLAANQLIYELKQTPKTNLNEENQDALKDLLNRSRLTLDSLAIFKDGRFKHSDLETLKKAEYAVFKAKLASIELDENTQNALLAEPEGNSNKLVLENPDARMDNIFQVQMGLLIATLSKLSGTDALIRELSDSLHRNAENKTEEEEIDKSIRQKPRPRRER